MDGGPQSIGRIDLDPRRARAGDPDAHRLQEVAQLDDVRFHGGVPDLRRPFRDRGREERRLGSGHRRFIEIDGRAVQAVGRIERVAGLVGLDRAHRDEGGEMRGDRPPGRKVAAGRGEPRGTVAREQRPQQQHRSAEAPDEQRIGAIARHAFAVDPQRARPTPLDTRAERLDEIEHHVDVPDPRHVPELAGLIREQAGGDQRQRRVLVALDVDCARQRTSTHDPQNRHQHL